MQTLTLALDKTFALDHTYADDGAYTVRVCVKDDELAEECEEAVITVANVAPVVSGAAPRVSRRMAPRT